MTPLQKIGKSAWSASSANMAMAQPSAWILGYVYNVRGSGNEATARGKAIEVGYDYFIENEFATEDEAVAKAVEFFNKDTALVSQEDKRKKERDAIDGFVKQCIEALKPYGKPTSKQNKLELRMDGVIDPWIGFDDYTYKPMVDDPRPICLDLKTTHRLPSEISDTHKRQMALYQMMRPDHKILICYVTPKKHAIFEMKIDDAIVICDQLKKAAQAGEKLIGLFDDPKELATLFAPDFGSSFYWNDPIIRAEAKRIWGY